jgi:hypothetical protein
MGRTRSWEFGPAVFTIGPRLTGSLQSPLYTLGQSPSEGRPTEEDIYLLIQCRRTPGSGLDSLVREKPVGSHDHSSEVFPPDLRAFR